MGEPLVLDGSKAQREAPVLTDSVTAISVLIGLSVWRSRWHSARSLSEQRTGSQPRSRLISLCGQGIQAGRAVEAILSGGKEPSAPERLS